MATLILAAFAGFLRPSIHGHDGVMNYAYLRSLLVDQDLDFTNDYTYYLDQYAEWFNNEPLKRDPETGRPINLYGVGSSLLWTPFVLIAHGFCFFAANPHFPANGYSRPYEWAVGIGSAFYASLGLWLLYRTLGRLTGRRNAFWAVLAVWLASPLVFYIYLHPSMSHANAFFLASLALWLYSRSDSLANWSVLGAVVGLLVSTRFQDASLLLGIAAGELWRLRSQALRCAAGGVKGRLMRYAAATVVAVVAFVPQLFAWHALQGTAFSGPRAYLNQGNVNPLAPVHLMEVLFSPRHGLFYWHPILILGAVGLLLPARNKWLQVAALGAFTGELWIISSWSVWWAGASFGQRMFISALPFLGIGISIALQSRKALAQFILQCLIVLMVLWNFGYIVQYGAGLISRQDGVPLKTLISNNLIAVPKLFLKRLNGSN